MHDAPATERNEVLGHCLNAAVVVDGDYRTPGGSVAGVQQDHLGAAGQNRRQLIGAQVRSHDDRAIDAAPQKAERRETHPVTRMQARQEQEIAPLAGDPVHAADDLRKELAVEVRQHDPDRMRARHAEAAGGRMRDVAQCRCSLDHALARSIADLFKAIQHARNRRHGDLCPPGNVADGGFGHASLHAHRPGNFATGECPVAFVSPLGHVTGYTVRQACRSGGTAATGVPARLRQRTTKGRPCSTPASPAARR